MIKVTGQFGGAPIYIAIAHIVAVRVTQHEACDGPGATVVTSLDSVEYRVDETPEEVMALIAKMSGHTLVWERVK